MAIFINKAITLTTEDVKTIQRLNKARGLNNFSLSVRTIINEWSKFINHPPTPPIPTNGNGTKPCQEEEAHEPRSAQGQ